MLDKKEADYVLTQGKRKKREKKKERKLFKRKKEKLSENLN